MRTGSVWPPASIVRSATLATSSTGPIKATIASIDARASAGVMLWRGGAPIASIWSSIAFMFGSSGMGGSVGGMPRRTARWPRPPDVAL